MATIWFAILAVMLGMYIVLDGFDFGVGAQYLWVARKDKERRAVLNAIGPLWDGNEVWLIASGGVLFFAFPLLYALSIQRPLSGAVHGAMASDPARLGD